MFREGLRPPDPFGQQDPFADARTQDGMSLKTLAEMSSVLVVCLPMLDGARRILADLAVERSAFEQAGVRLVVVHFELAEVARAALEPYDLAYVARVEDPGRVLYNAFGLGEVQRWLRGPAQLHGAFLFEGGEVVRAARPAKPTERIDFRKVVGG